MFNQVVKAQYYEILELITTIENFDVMFNERFHQRLVSKKQKEKRNLGHNASVFLQKLLTRSRYLLRGFTLAINDENSIMAFLTIRSHYETTGAVACLLKWLQKFYNTQCTYEELDNTLYKLFMGGRVFPDKSIPEYANLPDSLNVLSMIDDVDTLYKQKGGHLNKPFRESYQFQSEFCHPNFLGISQGSKAIMPSGIFEFQYPPAIEASEAKELFNNFIFSLSIFIDFFDECYDLLKENEELPKYE